MSRKKEQPIATLHGTPITRRDFLAAGLIQFSATMAIPTLGGLLMAPRRAEAVDIICGGAKITDLCPLITLNLSGGAALSANFVPMDQGLQLLPSYSKMGMGTGAGLGLVREFSNQAPFYASSGILQGILANSTTATRLQSAFVGVCVRSQDDSANNKFDITGLAQKAGMTGKILPNLGKVNTATGTKNTYSYIKPSSPLIVNRYEDILGALSLGGSLNALSKDQQVEMIRTVSSLSEAQSVKYMNMTAGEILAQLFQCANVDNSSLIAGGGGVSTDPLSNAAFSTIWNINNNTAKNAQDFVFASMVFNALNGNASTINLELGGYDYHNNTRTTGDAADLRAGVVIGKVLSSLALMGKKGFIVVTTDGSVTSPDSDVAGGPWASDRGSAGSMYMIAYNPGLAPSAKSTQLGHFTAGQAADDQFITGGVPELAAAAVFANYMSFNGKLGQFEAVLPRVFTAADLDKLTVIA